MKNIASYLILLTTLSLSAQTFPQVTSLSASSVTVTGTSEITVVPDTVRLSLNLSNRAKAAATAVADNQTRSGELLELFTQFEIAEKNVKTTNYSLYLHHERDGANRILETYHVVSHALTVKFNGLSRIGELVDAVARLDGEITFSLSLEAETGQEAYNTALLAALQDARVKANLLAEAEGLSLGGVLNIHTHGGVPGAHLESGRSFDVANIAPGQSTFKVLVTVDYLLQ